jgi:hypothetical protein
MSDLIDFFEGLSTGRLAAGGTLTLSAIAAALWPKREKLLGWLKSWRPAPAAVAPSDPLNRRDEAFAAFRKLADYAQESKSEPIANACVEIATELCRIPKEAAK